MLIHEIKDYFNTIVHLLLLNLTKIFWQHRGRFKGNFVGITRIRSPSIENYHLCFK